MSGQRTAVSSATCRWVTLADQCQPLAVLTEAFRVRFFRPTPVTPHALATGMSFFTLSPT